MKRTGLLVLITTALLFSCSQRKQESAIAMDSTGDNYVEAVSEAKSSAPLANAVTPTKDIYAGLNRNVIKKADFRFEVKDVHKTTDAIETLLLKWPAYIESSNLTQESGQLESKITIRIQNEYFTECLKAIGDQAVSIDFKTITTDNVSKEFVDLESRLRTKREVEARYTEILRKKAGTIEEVLQAEQQIGVLHEEIEATMQRLNYLKDQVGYSTISLEFYQPLEPVTRPEVKETFYTQVIDAFQAGWTVLTTLTLALIYIWPLLLGGGIVLVVLKLRKRKVAGI